MSATSERGSVTIVDISETVGSKSSPSSSATAPDAIAIRRKSALACSSSGVSLCWLRSSRCRYSATKRGAIGMGRRFSV